ncbi:metal-dependent hydrolase [Haloarchaeobius sp. DFWS5]|uniref:metal-dependent hydrolase n=1 Tax=Haloarchaeobius sp. DFWS5 TaxID=3446114 RepID=UPI003EB9D4D3
MWPWEHLAFGYILAHITLRSETERIDIFALVAVILGTQLPDIIDKPLAWIFGVLPSGTSLGHSLLFMVPVAGAVVAGCWYRDRVSVGIAFAVAYSSHLLGDLLYPLVFTGSLPPIGILFWPLVPANSSSATFTGNVIKYLDIYFDALLSPRGIFFLSLEFLLLGAALLLWVRDGRPGWPDLEG